MTRYCRGALRPYLVGPKPAQTDVAGSSNPEGLDYRAFAEHRGGEKTREEITDLMAGGEAMAELEAEIESHQQHPSAQPH